VPVIEAIGLRRTYRTPTGVVRRRRLEVEAVRAISFSVGLYERLSGYDNLRYFGELYGSRAAPGASGSGRCWSSSG